MEQNKDQSGAVAGCALHPKRFILDTNGLSYEQIAAISAEYRIETHIVSCIINAAVEAAPLPVQSGADVRGEAVADSGSHHAWKRAILYTDTIGGKQTCRDDLWAITTTELKALQSARVADAPSEPSETVKPPALMDEREQLIWWMGRNSFEGSATATRLDILSLVHSLMHNAYTSGMEGEPIEMSYVAKIENGLRAMKSRAADALDSQPTYRPWQKLWDSQWVSIVNYDHAYRGWSAEDAVHHAVKATEERCRLNNTEASSQPTVLLAGIQALCVSANQEFTRCKGKMPDWDAGFFAGQLFNFDAYTSADKTAIAEAREYLEKLRMASSQPTDGGVSNG